MRRSEAMRQETADRRAQVERKRQLARDRIKGCITIQSMARGRVGRLLALKRFQFKGWAAGLYQRAVKLLQGLLRNGFDAWLKVVGKTNTAEQLFLKFVVDDERKVLLGWYLGRES